MGRTALNPHAGEFEAHIDGEPLRFDTRLSTVAAIEAACGDRPIVEILNGIIMGRRARDQIPLIETAIMAAAPDRGDAAHRAGRTSLGEAEAFVLALILALGFSVGQPDGRSAKPDPLPQPSAGGAGAPSGSAV